MFLFTFEHLSLQHNPLNQSVKSINQNVVRGSNMSSIKMLKGSVPLSHSFYV